MIRSRRNAIVLEYDSESDSQVSHSPSETQSTPVSAKAKQKASRGDKQSAHTAKRSPKGLLTRASDEHHIRIGRRTVEDEGGDIQTQFLVIAKFDTARERVTWLSVATWQLNGLRIGALGAGDPIREEDDVFSFSTGLDPDPYFFARNAVSPNSIRELLLARLAQGEVQVSKETLEDDVAQRERDEAQWARLAEDLGPGIATTTNDATMRAVVGQDAKHRFPHPWALPVTLTRSCETIFPISGTKASGRTNNATRKNSKQSNVPHHLAGFNSITSDANIPSINVLATFVNKIDDHNLRLKHFIQSAFEPNETLESVKRYFRKGDKFADFGGLESNVHLARKWWLLEIWVLPQMQGCSTMYKWDDVPELPARAFCDKRALGKGGDGELRLFVEVRIVQDAEHVESLSEGDVSSGEEGSDL